MVHPITSELDQLVYNSGKRFLAKITSTDHTILSSMMILQGDKLL